MKVAALRLPKRAPKERRERLRLYGTDKAGEAASFWTRMPVSVLMDNLPIKSRRVDHSRFASVVGVGIGALMAFAIFSLTFWMLAPDYFIFAIFVGGFAGMWGGVIGWFAGKRFRPKPYWLAQFKWDGDKRVIIPFEHSQVDRSNVSLVHPGDDEEAEAQVMGVWRATTWYETEQMRDEKEDLRGGISTWEKIEAGSLALIALGLMAFLFLFFSAFAGE